MAEYKATSVQEAWDNHFGAFGEHDLDRILLDYNDESLIKVYTQETGELRQYKGVGQIRELFSGLFQALDRAPDIRTQMDPVVEEVDACGGFGHVFLLWEARSRGFENVTDTFVFDSNYTIIRQNVVVSPHPTVAAETPATVSTPRDDHVRAEDTAAQRAWDNHFAAFGEKDPEKVMEDYSEASVLRVYEHNGGQPCHVASSMDAIKETFQGLFETLADRSQLGAPVIHTEQLSDWGVTFLVWRSPTDGFVHATDTFVYNPDGKIIRQNVVTVKTADEDRAAAYRHGTALAAVTKGHGIDHLVQKHKESQIALEELEKEHASAKARKSGLEEGLAARLEAHRNDHAEIAERVKALHASAESKAAQTIPSQ
eukprot:TRINITY_DN30708_c0_g1_i1.p2 TRINITY_DN30708_c0_g1~~TRINITY_DN30708_c0_g1_i1.p2  ORF type:complete len:370 (+),score=121.17 TRINITY_DN30708_c0_g1_i1:58-1167(+)